MEIVIGYLMAAVALLLLYRTIRKPPRYKDDPADDFADDGTDNSSPPKNRPIGPGQAQP